MLKYICYDYFSGQDQESKPFQKEKEQTFQTHLLQRYIDIEANKKLLKKYEEFKLWHKQEVDYAHIHEIWLSKHRCKEQVWKLTHYTNTRQWVMK